MAGHRTYYCTKIEVLFDVQGEFCQRHAESTRKRTHKVTHRTHMCFQTFMIPISQVRLRETGLLQVNHDAAKNQAVPLSQLARQTTGVAATVAGVGAGAFIIMVCLAQTPGGTITCTGCPDGVITHIVWPATTPSGTTTCICSCPTGCGIATFVLGI
jgi:hypothetical protein